MQQFKTVPQTRLSSQLPFKKYGIKSTQTKHINKFCELEKEKRPLNRVIVKDR